MDRERFARLWDGYDRVLLFRELMLDLATVPVVLAGVRGPFFLLESANTKKEFSRYTYLGFPDAMFSLEDEDPFFFVEEMVKGSAPKVAELGDFSGGAVFLLGYGASNYTGLLRRPVRTGEDLALVMQVNRFVVLDNYTQKIFGCVVKERGLSWQQDYAEASDILDGLEADLRSVLRRGLREGLSSVRHDLKGLFWEMEREAFEETVAQVKGMIADGEAIQVVLSQKLEAYGALDPVGFYRYLRKLNPSPYMFFLRGDGVVYCGSSPEVHLKVMGGKALMKPIAGTYPVGEDLDAIIEALKSDEKERAEHLMLVDLARNDLYTHCTPESVEVPVFMEAEVYSHVVHLVSTVVGRLSEGIHPVELLRVTFPAGTVSGAPKVRAMEIIDELERSPRDFYAGCVGYYSYNGNLDTCITIRSARFAGEVCTLRAGAGIVYDSVPSREFEEVRNKLMALSVALKKLSAMEV